MLLVIGLAGALDLLLPFEGEAGLGDEALGARVPDLIQGEAVDPRFRARGELQRLEPDGGHPFDEHDEVVALHLEGSGDLQRLGRPIQEGLPDLHHGQVGEGLGGGQKPLPLVFFQRRGLGPGTDLHGLAVADEEAPLPRRIEREFVGFRAAVFAGNDDPSVGHERPGRQVDLQVSRFDLVRAQLERNALSVDLRVVEAEGKVSPVDPKERRSLFRSERGRAEKRQTERNRSRPSRPHFWTRS